MLFKLKRGILMNNQNNLDSSITDKNYQPRLKKGHVQENNQKNNIEQRQTQNQPPNMLNKSNQSDKEKIPQATQYQGIREDHEFGSDKKSFTNYWTHKQQMI